MPSFKRFVVLGVSWGLTVDGGLIVVRGLVVVGAICAFGKGGFWGI